MNMVMDVGMVDSFVIIIYFLQYGLHCLLKV